MALERKLPHNETTIDHKLTDTAEVALDIRNSLRRKFAVHNPA